MVQPIDIDLNFRPQRGGTVRTSEFGEEVMLIGEHAAFVLNPTGSVVWRLLDGEDSVGQLVAELSEAFEVDAAVVTEGVMALLRDLGGAGLLEGVSPPAPARTTRGLSPGTPLAGATLEVLGGTTLRIGAASDSQLLLINWNPACGYCGAIVSELDQLQPDLVAAGITTVLLAAGDEAANRGLLASADGSLPLALRADSSLPTEPFEGIGTPAAYLIDGDGVIVEGPEIGAMAVPRLARRLAGVEQVPTLRDGSRFLPAAGGACAPGASSGQQWDGTRTYRVGEWNVGVRANSAAAGRTIEKYLAAHRSELDGAADNFSVVLAEEGRRGPRGLNLLLSGTDVVVRSRSAGRVLRALGAHLSDLLADPPAPGLLRCLAPAYVLDGSAVLLPPTIRADLQQTQPRLARAGLHPADVPAVLLDVDAAEVIVPHARVVTDEQVAAGVDRPLSGSSEAAPALPGRYPLGSWLLPAMNGSGGPATPATATALAGSMVDAPMAFHERLALLAPLFDRVEAHLIPAADPREMSRAAVAVLTSHG